MLKNKKWFWDILEYLDWEHEGDDDLVIEPVIKKLSRLSDADIFCFEEIMAKLLYDIDGISWAKDTVDDINNLSVDEFLYNRCVAIVNGEEYYNEINKIGSGWRKVYQDGYLYGRKVSYHYF